jgi:hypothetical protein
MFSFILLSGCGLLINKREAKQEMIKHGMTFANVQQILSNNQISFEKVDEAIDINTGEEQVRLTWEQFIIKKKSLKDVLYITFAAPENSHIGLGNYRVHDMYWYKNWYKDTNLPVSLRKEKLQYINCISIEDLKCISRVISNVRISKDL